MQVERIRDLLDEGELEEARAALEGMMRKRPGQPDLAIENASLYLAEGEPAAALDALRGAERAADPAMFFYLRAAARYDLIRFEEALADARQAITVHPDMAPAWDLASRTLEHLGDFEEAAKAAAEAAAIDPESCPLPLEVSDAEFDALVRRSLRELPKPIRAKLDELPVLVQPLPSREMLTAEDPPFTPDLLGLFAGRHIFTESSTTTPSAPGAICLFRRNLLRACADREELAREVRITVQHEVGHYMGLDEDELDDWGLA
ncbi:MAG: metallopeptidase family protein [Candidatus Eisenbacteria bacterium]